MRKSDFSDVLAKARAAQAAGDPTSALQQLSSFIDVQKPVLVSRNIPKVVTEPFLPVILLHNELAISLHDISASRQSLSHYRKLFSFSAPFTVDQAFRDYIERIQNTLNDIEPDFDHTMLTLPGVSNERSTSLFSIQVTDLQKYQPHARTIIFAFLALRMIVETLRCTTMVGLYKDALDAFFLLCGQFNRKQEFIYVTERVLSGFTETNLKADFTVAVEYFKDRNLTDIGETDSDLSAAIGVQISECEYKKPNTLVASIYCRLSCIPLCHTFGLSTLAMKLLESSAADILLLTNSIVRACLPLHKLSCEYPTVEETPDFITLISTQSIVKVYDDVKKDEIGLSGLSVQDVIPHSILSLSTLSKERGPDTITQIRMGQFTTAVESIGTKGGASPATLSDLNAVIAAHLRAAISVFSSEGYLFAAAVSRYKAVKLTVSLDPQVKATLINEAFAALLSLHQDSLYSFVLMNYADMFGNIRTTNPSFFLNHPNVTRMTPASMVAPDALCFDKQVNAISLENNPVYQTRNLTNGNSFASISETVTSISILDSVLQDIVSSYSDHLQKELLDLLPLLYSERDLLVTITAKEFIAKAAACLIKLHDKWSLGESCVYLQEALTKKAVSLICIEHARNDLIHQIQSNKEHALSKLNSLTTQVTLSDIMSALKELFTGKLANSDLYKLEFIQRSVLDALRSKVFVGYYDFISQSISVLIYPTVSSFYLKKVDASFITGTLGAAPCSDNQTYSNLTKNIGTLISKDLFNTKSKNDKMTVAQLTVIASSLGVHNSDCTAQHLERIRQAHSSAKLRIERIRNACELEQKKLDEYKEMVIMRQQRDEKLDMAAQEEQRKAKRAAEVRQLKIKMAKQFIDEVAIKMHDTELITYLTSFDLETIQNPNDQIKILHRQFEIERGKKKLARDIRTSNLAELTLLVAMKEAKDNLMALDCIEDDRVRPMLKQIHEMSQKYEQEKHIKNQNELRIYNKIPGLDEFVGAYINDCKAVYNNVYAEWKAERDKVLEEIQNELKKQQEIKNERKIQLMNRAKAKMVSAKIADKTDRGSTLEQPKVSSTNASNQEGKTKSASRDYAAKFIGRK